MKWWQTKRYRVVILCQFGLMVVYSLRVNLSVAIVSMVNNANIKQKIDPECSEGKNITVEPNVGVHFTNIVTFLNFCAIYFFCCFYFPCNTVLI